MQDVIQESFYRSIYPTAEATFLAQRAESLDAQALRRRVKEILHTRDGHQGLSVQQVSWLLQAVRSVADPATRAAIVDAARAVRRTCFGNQVATMVPIEVTSYCASTCKFCGWRADNKDMVRLAISETAIREQAKILARMGFSHFEIAGGDHLPFLRNSLKPLVRALKEETRAVNPEARVSLCLVPMHEAQYTELREHGLDCVLTWQETYCQELFAFHVPSGPKAWGIDLDFAMTRGGDGFMQRLRSQEMAIRSGLQAGLGAMIGLAEHTEADILSVVIHGQRLIEHYGDAVQPLIIGMPAWNSITTTASDNRESMGFNFHSEANFELIAAIYLLAYPDRRAWVFANGRVAPQVQVDCIESAAFFTSTLVQIAPGAYLGLQPEVAQRLGNGSIFIKSSIEADEITQEAIMSGEQFMHYLMPHDAFLQMFSQRGLQVVSDRSMLLH
ncbi:radical SAM protein [Pseudorhodoferax sp.]|uniref:radical SAM protein n=1 Tax=Pseudorhodoferax sp. TaxID=1993553 RepID=UPI002DD6A027|nr:radical SAM protein [Pseudorhodoferax sp.]